MQIREYLQSKVLIADGAFGTYYAQKYDTNELPEKANIYYPERVMQIHTEYLNSGAKMLRTNTFACNKANFSNKEELILAIRRGCEIAIETAKSISDGDAYVFGDIGPIPRVVSDKEIDLYTDYTFIADVMIKCGITHFMFETFADVDEIIPVADYIKQTDENAFICIQMCSNQHGYTAAGIHVRKAVEKLSSCKSVDAAGLNCGIGPSSMKKILNELSFSKDKFISALPNASFLVGSRGMVFNGNPGYFAEQVKEIIEMGADIVGGCCGTDPRYIREISERKTSKASRMFEQTLNESSSKERIKDSSFWKVAKKNTHIGNEKRRGKLITVELAPPFGADDQKIMDSANALIKFGIDGVTLPDSPSGRTRADSILMANKVYYETKIPAIPHICCRDRNVISLRSTILGAYINGIRNALIITGDPVPTLMRQDIKSVFNFDSVGLMKVLQQMNEDEFYKDPIVYGAALSYNRPNLEIELSRMEKKIDAGASFFMTQPVFSKEDIDRLYACKQQMEKISKDAKLFCGLMPLVSYKNARFIQNEMSGINVPDSLVNSFSDDMTRREGELVGISSVKKVMDETKDFVDGYYFSIPFNRVYLLEDIIG